MTTNPLLALQQFGQSVWMDNISRGILKSGELDRLIREEGLRGVTSNPTIFQKAISGSAEYDDTIRRLASQGKSSSEIMDALIIEDIQQAADRLRPLYDQTQGQDGFVSIEVSPRLAHDTPRTIDEVRRLARLVGRPNVLVKIPGTREGLPAIQQMLAEGYHINITLLFAIERYEAVIEAHLSALEQRVRAGKPIDRLASVASFFVSRVDTVVDQQLEAGLKQSASSQQRDRLTGLLGRAAIANAKLAYQRFKAQYGSERFAKLKAKGAQVQRVLWASTSTKNPNYRDVRYVEELIGPDTVNTMPETTMMAFKDHGRIDATLEQGLEEAERLFQQLADVGIDLARVTQDLEEAGVKAFADSFQALLDGVEAKRDLILT